MTAHAELAEDDFKFMLMHEGETWPAYLERVDRDYRGEVEPGRVRATMFLAFVGDDLVGRLHIRHELTPGLLLMGGHIGYGVRPGFRRRGYAAEMLRQALTLLRDEGVDRALVTCDDDNVGSIRTIERNGGVLENIVASDGEVKRRYWIELT